MLEHLESNPRSLLIRLAPTYHPGGTSRAEKAARARAHEALGAVVGVTPRTIDRWFQWALATGKQNREPTGTERLTRLAGRIDVQGGRFQGGACVSSDCRDDRTMTLPRVTNAQAMQQLNEALRAGDEDGAQAAYWSAYGVTPDDVWDQDFTLSPDRRK